MTGVGRQALGRGLDRLHELTNRHMTPSRFPAPEDRVGTATVERTFCRCAGCGKGLYPLVA